MHIKRHRVVHYNLPIYFLNLPIEFFCKDHAFITSPVTTLTDFALKQIDIEFSICGDILVKFNN